MISIDTNVLVRIVIEDHKTQSEAAKQVFEEGLESEGIWIPLIVLVESVWVLKKRYQVQKPDILAFLTRLLKIPGVGIERRAQVESAIIDWEVGNADFTDYVILGVSDADGCRTTYTFEKKKMGADPRATILEA
jgi:predicted nucleic-acid-binding protein